jgi:hypothetical protein
MLLVGKPNEKRPLGRPGRRWVDNIKVGLGRERMGWGGLVCLRIEISGELV